MFRCLIIICIALFDFSSAALASIRVVTLSPNLTTIVHQIIESSHTQNVKLVGAVHYMGQPSYLDNVKNIGDSYSLNMEEIISLKPTVVLAFRGEGNQLYVSQLKRLGLNVISLEAKTLFSVGALVEDVGRAINLPKVSQVLAKQYWQSLRTIENNQIRNKSDSKPRTFIQYGDFPLFAAGGKGVMERVIQLCNGENIFHPQKRESFPVSKLAVLAKNPDVIFSLDSVLSKGVAYKQLASSEWEGFTFLRAVKFHQIYAINPNTLSQMTPGILSGIRVVCQLISQSKT